jgi:hypothetical protein
MRRKLRLINFLVIVFFIIQVSISSSQDYTSWIGGKVIDKATGLGIPQIRILAVRVEIKGEKGQIIGPSFSKPTNSQGVYLIPNIPPGDYWVYPYPSQGYVIELQRDSKLINVPPARTGLTPVVANFELEKGGSISGRVTKEDGTGFSGVNVYAFVENGTAGHAITDINGRYIIEGVSPSQSGMVSIGVTDYMMQIKTNISIYKNQETTVDFVVNKLNRIEGKVTDSNGMPIENVVVLISSDSQVGLSLTDTQGRYSVAGLEIGKYEIKASAPGFLPGKISDVEVIEGVTTLNIILQKNTEMSLSLWRLMHSTLNTPKFTLLSSSTQKCPCRDENNKVKCPDCPGGNWAYGEMFQSSIAVFVGVQTSVVGFTCLNDPSLFCLGQNHCYMGGFLVGINFSPITGGLLLHCPCCDQLGGWFEGVYGFVQLPDPKGLGLIGLNFSILYGGGCWTIEAGPTLPVPTTIEGPFKGSLSFPVGTGYISCYTSISGCRGVCGK